VTGTITGQGTFDTVEIASPVSLPGILHSTVYQSEIDLNGIGLYVQPITSHQSNAHTASLTHDPLTGDIYIGFMTDASKTHLGSGYPVGFTQDLALMGENPSSRFTIAKLGSKETPYCIESASNGENQYDILANECFIDQICYKKSERGMKLNLPCQICAPSFSQTKWMPFMVGRNYCHIDGVCYEADEHLATRSGFVSECQVCTPDNSAVTWSLKHGFEDSGLSPPNDCAVLEIYYDEGDDVYDDDDGYDDDNISSLEDNSLTQDPWDIYDDDYDGDDYDDDNNFFFLEDNSLIQDPWDIYSTGNHDDDDDDGHDDDKISSFNNNSFMQDPWDKISINNDDAAIDDLFIYLDDDSLFNTSYEADMDNYWFDNGMYDDDDDDDDEEAGALAKYASLGIEFIILIVLGSVFLLSVTGYGIKYYRRRNNSQEFFPTEGCDLT